MITRIKRTRYEDHADRWTAFDADGRPYPYSKIFKNMTVERWLAQGHMISHKTLEDGDIEIWNFID